MFKCQIIFLVTVPRNVWYFRVFSSSDGCPYFVAPAFSTPAFSTPVFSTPAIYSCIFHSYIFHPLRYAPAFSTPAFSAPPPNHLLGAQSWCTVSSPLIFHFNCCPGICPWCHIRALVMATHWSPQTAKPRTATACLSQRKSSSPSLVNLRLENSRGPQRRKSVQFLR